MFKKILSVMLVLGMLLSFTACKKSKTSGDVESSIPETSSVETESSDDKLTDSALNSVLGSASSENESSKAECAHKFSAATCTAAAKCTLCGFTNGTALGHSYSAGKCSRCGAADKNYATYKSGGKNSIVLTRDGKTTTLKIDTSAADERLQNISSFASSPSMNITYEHFLEVEGWLYFAQSIAITYTYNNTAYDVNVDEIYKIKTDGTNQTKIATFQETEDKGIGVSEVFGFEGNNIYYVVENEDEGICSIYKATVSSGLTNLITGGKKLTDAYNDYATIFDCSIKDGYLYFSEKRSTYNTETSSVDTVQLGKYKAKLDGTGITKIS